MRRASIRGCNRSEARQLERITTGTHRIAGSLAVYFGVQDERSQRLVRRLFAFNRRDREMVADE
jgi:hypothetical protein